jgi:hypothetical protein
MVVVVDLLFEAGGRRSRGGLDEMDVCAEASCDKEGKSDGSRRNLASGPKAGSTHLTIALNEIW